MNKKPVLVLLILSLVLVVTVHRVQAQAEPEYPYYVIQSGDTLLVVAQRFGVSMDDLISLNELSNPDALSAGDTLKIPGYEGVSGELVFHTINLGESYQTLTRQYQFPSDLISRLNRLLNQDEIYVGSRLIIPLQEDRIPMQPLFIQPAGQTLLESAAAMGLNPWEILLQNRLFQPANILAGDTLYQQGQDETEMDLMAIPGVQSIEISPLPFVQGKTIVLKVKTASPMDLTAEIDGRTVPFFNSGGNDYVGLHGISAQADTGVITIALAGSQEGSRVFSLQQRILVDSGYYGEGPAVFVDPVTIDPEITEPEQDLVEGITSVINPERYWSGMFQYPVDEPCINAGFGGSRVYNGTYHYYHTGLDFAVCSASNANIYAAAPGRVVYVGSLVVRGNAVIIDHGWGVYSGYWHQSSTVVKEGDFVEAGDLLGIIGTTGRSTGYHLHFEVWVNGTQVDPTEWLSNEYP